MAGFTKISLVLLLLLLLPLLLLRLTSTLIPLLLLPHVQVDAVHWSPSLVFLPAIGLVAGRAIKVLTTIKVGGRGIRRGLQGNTKIGQGSGGQGEYGGREYRLTVDECPAHDEAMCLRECGAF